MAKSDECDRCQMFSGLLGEEYLVCGIHPSVPAETPCPDYAPVVEEWVPEVWQRISSSFPGAMGLSRVQLEG